MSFSEFDELRDLEMGDVLGDELGDGVQGGVGAIVC